MWWLLLGFPLWLRLLLLLDKYLELSEIGSVRKRREESENEYYHNTRIRNPNPKIMIILEPNMEWATPL